MVEQVPEQTLILVDGEDNVVGYAPRGECHAGDGKLHRAIAVVVERPTGEILLQRRRSWLWSDVWDISGATHPLRLAGRDESYEDATARCLWTEWGIVAPARRILAFEYFDRYGADCENEYCALMWAQYGGPLRLNPEHAFGLRWASVAECRHEMRIRPAEFTPWAHIAIERLTTLPLGTSPLKRPA